MPIYTYNTLDDPSSTQDTLAYGINDTGQIVGYYFIGTTASTHGFLLSGGVYTPLDDPLAVPQAGGTLAFGINASGQIVGQYADLHGTHGFLLSGGTYAALDDPSAPSFTRAYGINASGQIVGIYTDASAHTHGFLYSNGTYTNIDDPLGTHGSNATGINAAGQIVGRYIDSNFQAHGFLYSNGSYTTLDDPLGVNGSSAWGINDMGQIVGQYSDGSGKNHSFLYSGGIYITLDDPVATDGTFATGINAAGQIVGQYMNGSVTHGFLEITMPNPAPPPGTTADMILRGANNSPYASGQYEIYDIGSNAILAGYSLGTVGTDWQFVGLRPFYGSDTSDMVLRNVNTGAFEVYDIANNQITAAALLGTVGLDWQVGGFAANAPSASNAAMGDSSQVGQLAQAMASFGAGSGAADGLNVASLTQDSAQQALLTPPQHA
jgi:probable HAF family extracellular repeat protein